MKWIIEVEETVRVHHQIVVNINNDSDLDRVLENIDDMCDSLDDFIDAVADVVPVLEVNNEYDIETNRVEYYDDYECDY